MIAKAQEQEETNETEKKQKITEFVSFFISWKSQRSRQLTLNKCGWIEGDTTH